MKNKGGKGWMDTDLLEGGPKLLFQHFCGRIKQSCQGLFLKALASLTFYTIKESVREKERGTKRETHRAK